jgi:hypothetical protein
MGEPVRCIRRAIAEPNGLVSPNVRKQAYQVARSGHSRALPATWRRPDR